MTAFLASRAAGLAACLALTLPQAALAQTNGSANPAITVLLAQGAHWVGQNRPDLALRAFERALAAEPRNPDALAGAARAQGQLGNAAAAERSMAELRTLLPTGEPRLVAAEAGMRGATMDRTALAEARRLAQGGQQVAAVARYRELFGGRSPPDQFAAEYYLTLGGTPGGFAEAREGLTAVQRSRPADWRVELALGQLLTFQPETRAAGVARLRPLVAVPPVSREALGAWRQALLWGGPSASAIPAMEGFLQQAPNDPAITRLIAEAQAVPAPPGPGDEARIRGFADLERNRLRDAGAAFEAAIARNPNDADALGGLGVVRLREGGSAEARTLLERAVAADPAGAPRWRQALDGASYTTELAEARVQLRRNELDRGEATLRRAVARDVTDRADAETLLGDVLLQRGDATAAEARYRAALARRAEFGLALSGLERALRAQGRMAEASEIARRLPGPAASPGSGSGRAATLRAEAERTSDPGQAAALLQNAIAADPRNPWVRLDLARLLRRQGRPGEGRAIVEGALSTAPASTEALHAAALYAEEEGRTADASGLLQQIPPARRSADMSRLLARSRVQAEVAAAAGLLPGITGRQQLLSIAARPDPSGSAGAAVVRAFGAANDVRSAEEAARVALVGNSGAAARLVVGGALLDAGAADAVGAISQQLLASPGVSAEQRRQVLALQDGVAVQTADLANERGDQAAGFEALRPVLARDPQDRAASLALARLYAGAGRGREAQRLAEAVLARDTADYDARATAVGSALAARDTRRAEQLVAEGRALAPADPRVSLLEARVAQASGDNRRAEAALQRAAAERGAQGGVATASSGVQNPFRTGAGPVVAAGGDRMSADMARLSAEIARESARAREETAPQIRLSAGIRARSGTAGLDRLDEVGVQLEGRFSAGPIGGQIFARVNPVSLTSGDLPSDDTSVRRFGQNAVSGRPPASRVGSGNASGVGLEVAYRRDGLSMDVGTTPIGFREQNMVGGIEVAPEIARNTRLRLTAERRAMTDSVLSWSGAVDPVTGQTWGGVVRTGGRGQIEYSEGPFSLYAGGGYYTIDGRQVANNNRIEAGAGVSYAVWRRPEDELTVGADLAYFAYNRNLRHFTFGQGGYFSPQSFAALNFPVDYRARQGALSWRLGATAGLANWRESSTPYYPTSSALQGQLESRAAQDPTRETQFAGRSTTSFGGQLRGDIEYRIRPNIGIGGQVRYDAAPDWNEARALFFARYRFD